MNLFYWMNEVLIHVHTGCKATIDLVQPMVQPNTVYTVFDNRNVSNTFGGHWMQIYFALACMRSTDTRNSVLSCLNMSNAYFNFFSQSLTLGDSKTRLELEFLKKDMNIPYAPVLQNISDISSMVSFIQLLQFILYTFYHT